jgi:hypothetical protein
MSAWAGTASRPPRQYVGRRKCNYLQSTCCHEWLCDGELLRHAHDHEGDQMRPLAGSR